MTKFYRLKHLYLLFLPILLLFTQNSFAALNGNYTLIPSAAATSTNYKTFASFNSDLISGTRADGGTANGVGITGNVTLRVAPGITLTEQVEFRSVTGVTSTRFITIKGGMATVDFTSSSTTNKHTMWLNGAKYFVIDSLNIRALGTVQAWAMRFSNDASFNTISNCNILVPNITTGVAASTTSTSTQAAICFNASSSTLDFTARSSTSGGTNGSNNKIMNCTIGGSSSNMGPTYGIFDTQTDNSGNNSYINNRVQHYFQEGISCLTTDGITITGNDINRLGNSTTPGSAHKGINLLNNVRATTKPITVTGNSIHDISTSTTLYGFYHANSTTYITNYDGGNNLTTFSNNKIYNLSNTTTFYCAYFANVRNSGGYNIKNNEIYKNSNTSTMYCIYNNNSEKAVFDANTIRNNKASTIYCIYDFGSSTNSTFSNNLIFKNVATSIEYGIRTAGTGIDWVGNNYSNNTIAFDSVGWVSSTTYGLYLDGGVGFEKTNNKVFNNNIFIGHKGSSSTVLKYGIYNIDGYSGYTEEANNVYFDTANVTPATTYYGSEYSGTLMNLATLASWKALGFSSRDLNENPRFIKSTYFDYRTNNPLLNKVGANAGISTDFNGTLRFINSPDIGAYEKQFNLAYDSVNILNSTLCSGKPDSIRFRISNNNGYTIGNVQMGVSVNGVLFTTGTAFNVKNGFTTFTFPTPMNISVPGIKKIKFFALYRDGTPGDDTITRTVNVIAAPGGSSISLKSGSKGILNHINGYDVTALDETITYNLTRPRTYTDAEYGTKWIVTATITDTTGKTITGSNIVVSHPSQTEISYTPFTNLVDRKVNINFIVRDLVTGCDTVYKRMIFIAPKGIISLSIPSSVCFNTVIDFVNNSTISSGNLIYTWDFGDGSDIYTGQFAKHNYTAVGRYFVTLSTVSTPFGYIRDSIFTIDVKEIPRTDFSKVNACENQNIVLTNKTKVNTGTPVYTWDFGDGSATSNLVNVNKTYAMPGVYNVTLNAEKDGCESSVSKTVYQFAKPVADFSKTSGECLNSDFTFTDNTSTALGRHFPLWDFDDAGTTSTDENPTYRFKTTGVKNVKLVVTSEFGCKDSAIKIITVKQVPVANFTFPFTCSITPTTFSNTSNLNGEALQSYMWNFGDGTTSTTNSPVKTWSSLGTKEVSLKVNLLNGCTSEITKTVNVGEQPQVDFNAAPACSGSEVAFDNLTEFNPTRINYQWIFGDGFNSNVNSPSHIFNTASTRTYTVKLIGSVIGGCADSITKTVLITALPETCDFNIVGNTNFAKTNFSFNPIGGNSAGVTYSWVTGDGNTLTSIGSGTTYRYDAPGAFCVKMLARNSGGCVCEKTKCISLTTGIESFDLSSSLTVYPNPSNGKFTVNLEANTSEKMTIDVYNSTGMLIKSVTIDNTNTEIDLEAYSAGIYIIKVKSGAYTATKKLTIN